MNPTRVFSAAALAALFAVLVAFVSPAHAEEAPFHLKLGGPAPEVKTEADLRAFLDELEAQEFMVYEASTIEGYYQWKGETRHFGGPFARFANDLRTRKDYAAIVDQWKSKVADSLLARRLEVQAKTLLVSRADPALVLELSDLQTALQDTVTAFRYRVGGKALTRTEISEILDLETDRAKRREAFLALQQIARKTMPVIRRGLELNDRIGKGEGFSNGAEAGLALASLDRAKVLADLDAFERATRPTMLAIVAQTKKDLKLDRAEPWDVDHWLHLQEIASGDDAWPREPGVERMKALMKAIGFEPDSLPIDTKVWDVPTGGITFPVRPPYESRLLTNPFPGSTFYETLFHEYGHCLDAVFIDRDLPAIFLMGDETPINEGVAECIGHFAYDANWLRRAAGVSPERAAQLERVGKLQLLVWLRRVICLNAFFEITAYGDLNADLDSLYNATYARFMCVELPKGSSYFATRDLFVTGPLYLQSYLYANMIATQLREAMRRDFGVDDLSNEPRVAAWMTSRMFRLGGSVAWPEKVRRATGRPLGTEALARYLAGAIATK